MSSNVTRSKGIILKGEMRPAESLLNLEAKVQLSHNKYGSNDLADSSVLWILIYIEVSINVT